MSIRINFHLVEFVAALVVIALIAGVVWFHKSDMDAYNRDQDRKASINAVYYNLEEVYFAKTKSFPLSIGENTLSSISPDALKDPDGFSIGDPRSDFSYQPSNCVENVCQNYLLRADLEQESMFVKTNR